MRTVRAVFLHKGFAAGAVITLALGIAAATTIFSVVHGVLLRPLPYPEPERLVRLSEFHQGANAPFRGAWLSNLTYFAWGEQARTIGPIAIFSGRTSTVGDTNPQRVEGASVSPALFDILQVRPLHGRFFVSDDVVQGAAPVVVISDGFWRERFGGDLAALGQTLAINRTPHQVVGIAPPDFAFPSPDARFWTPAAVASPGTKEQPRMSVTSAIARLKNGFTLAQAAAEGTAAARQGERPFVAELLFGKGGPVEVRVEGVVEQMTKTIRPALLVLSGAVVVLLLIACANVANLLLSRGIAREREVAIRMAIGAGRGHIVRQLLAEALVIAVAAGALGIMAAWALLRVLPTVAPENLPRLSDVRLDGTALLVACLAVLVSALFSGLIPAVRAARPQLLPSLREGSGASSSARHVRLRQVMLVGEAALAVMLLIGSGLLIRSFVKLISVDPGYDASNVLTAEVYLPGAEDGRADSGEFLDEFLPRLRAMPAVVAAGASNMMPLGGSTSIVGFTIDLPGRAPITARGIAYRSTPGYAEALQLRLRAGRLLDARDRSAPLQAMVVNEEFVRTFLDGVAPVGVQFPSIFVKGGTAEIVGVVADVLKEGLDAKPQPEVYVALDTAEDLRSQVSLVVRTDSDPSHFAATLRTLLLEIHPDAALDNLGALSTRIDASVAQPRFAAWVLGVFAALALILSAVGLYSVLAYTVSRRQRELGVRTALGASRSSIVSLVCRDGVAICVIGLVIGVGAAAALSRMLDAMLFGIEPLDPVAFVIAPMTLLTVALVACLVPAFRAASTDPTVVLRAE
jgi:putative ABC transport system permease protein